MTTDQTFYRKETFILIISVFIAGLCSIIYELLISTASSYFLGDSVKQFSITIGFYMAAMGAGSYYSRHISDRNLISVFIFLEIILGAVGGLAVPILYSAFAYTQAYTAIMIGLIIIIGLLIGFEIPLLARILEKYYTLKINISTVLSLDYLGALVATLLFPLLLLPLLGIFNSSLIFGLINMSIAFMNIWCFASVLPVRKIQSYLLGSILLCIFLIGLMAGSQWLVRQWSSSLYEDRIVMIKQTKYQQLVLTKQQEDIRLFINGNLQFSSIDEYRYHESLVHVPAGLASSLSQVLICGGGDGLVVKQLLKYPQVKRITVVDLDPEMTKIACNQRYLKALNQNSLTNEKVKLVHQDAFVFMKQQSGLYDLIILDLPDPNNVSLARLYSREFYQLVKKHLSAQGIFVTQATSPFFAPEAFWCIAKTIESTGLAGVYPYHAYVPSFGDWGFVLAANQELDLSKWSLDVETRYLTPRGFEKLFVFEKDLLNNSSNISTLDNPDVLQYYLKGWKHYR